MNRVLTTFSRMPLVGRALVFGSLLSFLSFSVLAADPQGEKFYEQSIKPIFAENCYKCHSHSAEKIKGGLVVDSLGGLLKGGDTGPAIVPGKPTESLLLKAVSYQDKDLQMPPKDKKLKAEQITALEEWIKMGAPWPGSDARTAKSTGRFTEKDRSWWAFQSVKNPPVPATSDSGWAQNSIDKFVFARLAKAELHPATEADRRTLIRRVSYDLTGLPPSVDEINAFVSDSSSNAYSKVVERLLESPRYGERSARWWMDLVRYAESDGYKADGYRPNVWRYRDYVIKSFNDDKPFDRFVKEQLAGDELYPNNPEATVATTFLRHWIYEFNNPDVKGQVDTVLNELTDVTGDVFIGLGMSCAKCHDHKYDPILQKDYFRLQAYFAPLIARDDLVVATESEKKTYAAQLAKWEERTKDIRAQIAVMEQNFRRTNAMNAMMKMPDDVQEILLKPASKRTPNEEVVAQMALRQVNGYFDQLESKFKGADKEQWANLQKQLSQFDSEKPKPLPQAMTVSDVGPVAPETFIPKSRIKDSIAPGILTLLDEKPAVIEPVPTAPNSTGRRTALANWITQPNNPLTTRVIVNRIWQQHFGRGLVATTSDFGRLGQPPTHPELLDWLTTRFVNNGWSMKDLHRLIVTSAAYRQSANVEASDVAMKNDPENLLLWRMNSRRLDADQIRDSVLAASGELNLEMGGPSIEGGKPRRSIYTHVRRNTPDPMLEAFDGPDNIVSTPQRNVTTTANQALLMFNSQFMAERARALGESITKQKIASKDDLVATAMRRVLRRDPSREEIAAFTKFVDAQSIRIERGMANPKPMPFVAEPLPEREGKAALLEPMGLQPRFEVPESSPFPDGDFTVEAIIMAKSVADDAAIHAIASHWSGSKSQPGWTFGIAGRKSSGKPQHLALQLNGNSATTGGHDTLYADTKIETNKPYYVAATVKLGETNAYGVTFYVKNLANDEEPIQISRAPHLLTDSIATTVSFMIGGDAGVNHRGQFHGLIDEVRLTAKALAQEQLLLTAEGTVPETVGYWKLKSEKDYYVDRSTRGNHIKVALQDNRKITPLQGALEDLCHVLMNSNEFFYVD